MLLRDAKRIGRDSERHRVDEFPSFWRYLLPGSIRRFPWAGPYPPEALYLLFVGAILVLFWPVALNHFVNLDDPYHVTQNYHVLNGISSQGLAYAFTDMSGLYHPVTWLSLMLDIELFGVRPVGFHMTNLWLHVINSILVMIILRHFLASHSAAVTGALVFALHPIMVESVAWISERKGLLSGTGALLTTCAFCQFLAYGQKRWLLVAYAAFGLGLLAKPLIAPLPMILTAVLLLPGLRRGFCRVAKLRWLLPFYLLAAVAVGVNVYAQTSAGLLPIHGVAKVEPLQALSALWLYVYRIALPFELSAFYPREALITAPEVFAGLMIAFLLLWTMWRQRATMPTYTLGIGWFLVALLPGLGFVPNGAHHTADRYAYFAVPGLVLALTSLLCKWRPHYPRVLLLVRIVGIGYCLYLGIVVTPKQISTWKSSSTLYRHCISVDPANWLALANLGALFLENSNVESALPLLRQAQAENPSMTGPLGNMGQIFYQQKEFAKANIYFEELSNCPALNARDHFMIARSRMHVGRPSDAVPAWRRALGANEHTDVRYVALLDLALVLATIGDPTLRAPEEAYNMATSAVTITRGTDAYALIALAVATYANAAPPSQAKELLVRAVEFAEAEGNVALKKAIKQIEDRIDSNNLTEGIWFLLETHQ